MIYTLCPFCGERIEMRRCVKKTYWPNCKCGAVTDGNDAGGELLWTTPGGHISVICEESEGK